MIDNVVGTCNLLNYARELKDLKLFIFFSTDEVFGPAPEGVYYKEWDTHNPSNPYAGSKAEAEDICKSFAFTYGLPVMITRTMNVISERQHSEKFLPKTVKAILNNEKVILHGVKGVFSSRCWIHARNVLETMLFIIEKREVIEKKYQNDPGHGIYHIVGEERNVLEIANIVCEVIKGGPLKENEYQVIDAHSQRPGHDIRYSLSGEKLKKMGFQFPLTLEESLRRTVKWMIKPQNLKWLNL